MKRAEKERLLFVDGYNIMGAWPEMMRERTLAQAREHLVECLHDYAGYSGQRVIVVFDAWQSDRQQRSREERDRLSSVFTQKGETADHYIERACGECTRRIELGKLEVRVATSDAVEQTVILGRGATRLSARELLYEMNQVRKSGVLRGRTGQTNVKSTVFEHISPEVRARLEEMRRGGGTC